MIPATALKRPRTKPPEIRREELMDAAQALFIGKGFAATSVDEIVRAADVAKGTFYLYFKTKEDVLLALRERFIVTSCSRLDTALAEVASKDWAVRLDAWIEAGMTCYLDQVALHDLVFHEFRPTHRRMPHDNPVIARLATLLVEGERHGAWMIGPARLTAVMVFNAMHGAVDDALVDTRERDRAELVAVVQAFCRRALGLKTRFQPSPR